MKTKTLLSVRILFLALALSPALCALSQIPQGFNYQAVARTTNGGPVSGTTIQVKMGILSDTLTPVIVYEELHSTVKTDVNGVFNVVIGTGVRQSGSAASFSQINWNLSPLYLRVQINYQGAWKVMGNAKLWSVPYSMVAGDLAGALKKLSVSGQTSTNDEALFEVKNKNGQTVFAVFNEGVRVYVSDGAKGLKGGFAVGGFGTDKTESTKYLFVGKDSVRIYLDTDPTTKKLKGGFAVGGYNLTKGIVQNYLDVSSDSVRIYVDSDPLTKKLKGGFAVGGYDMTKGIKQDYFKVSPDSVRIYIDSDPGSKSLKGGFAVGGYNITKGLMQDYLDISPDSVRIYIDDKGGTGKGRKGGFAVGGFDITKDGNKNFLNVEVDTTGIIKPAQNRILWYPLKNAFLTGKVLIESKDSVGENSFASGFESKAKGKYSQALGYNAIARGDYSTSIGKNSISDSINSFSFGENVIAGAKNSYSFGKNTKALGDGSFAFGLNGLAIGQDSYVFGTGAEAYGTGSFAMGFIGRDSANNTTGNTLATSDYSIALGMGTQSTAKGALAIGMLSKTGGIYSTSIGYGCTANGIYGSTSMGYMSIASGQTSVAIGYKPVASGKYSIALGGWSQMILGHPWTQKYTEAIGTGSVAIGSGLAAKGVFSISIGTGANANVRYSGINSDGGTAKGDYSVSLGCFNTANGHYSLASGYSTTSQSYNSFVFGRFNVIEGDSTQWINTDPLFVLGNGSISYLPRPSVTRSNAFTVYKNGNTYIQGNIGIGSLNPTAKLEVNLTNSAGWSGNLKALRVFTPDNAYYLDLNTSIISAGNAGYHFNPNGNTGLTITTPGNVGIGISAPSQRLHVNGDIRLEGGGIQNLSGGVGVGSTLTGWYSDVSNLATRIPGSAGDLYVQTASGSSTYLRVGPGIGGMELFVGKAVFDNAVGIATSSVGTYKLYVNGNAYCTGSWGGSDLRWKKNIVPLCTLLSAIQQLTPVSYEWRRDEYPEINFDNGRQIGLVAQDVEKIFPELVRTDNRGYKAVSYEKLSVVLLEAIKEQQQLINICKSENESLKSRVGSLQEKVEKIEALLATENDFK